MHKTIDEAVSMVKDLNSRLEGDDRLEIGIAPPFTALHALSAVKNSVQLVAQNVHFEPKGAFTGEISVPMLTDIGCDYVLVGHSERRQLFGETDELIAKKVKAVLDGGIKVILAVGETLEEREQEETLAVVSRQVSAGLEGLEADALSRVVLAYEPVWAIGTGRTASPEQAQEVHKALREQVKSSWGEEAASGLRIQYGGSIKPANASALFGQPDVDGGLVGGASLKADDFATVCQAMLA